MSSQATFEPVSAKTQPVSGHTTCQIPDIENSCSRDSSRKTPPSVGSARFSSPKTRPLPANPRECRRFSHTWKSHRRDRTGWLGCQDSNLGMAESKSTMLPSLQCSFRKINEIRPVPINRLDADSECAAAAQTLRCSVYQGAGKVVGSTTGATPNATETMANPIKTVEAQTPKAISHEIRRSCIAMGGYKTVGENRVMSVSKSIASNHDANWPISIAMDISPFWRPKSR